MTFNFFNKPFNITALPELSNGSFTFNYRGINGTGVTPPPVELIKEWFGYPIQTAYSLAGDLLNWKVYGNTKQQLLPDGYTQLEYIEKTNANGQYLDINIKLSNNSGIEMKYNQVVSAGSAIFGVSPLIEFRENNNGAVKAVRYNGIVYTTTNDVNAIDVIKLDKNKVYINGELKHTFTSAVFTSTNNAYLFKRNVDDSSAQQEASGKIYYCKIWEDIVLVRDLIPAKRNSDNVLGMYDLVSKTFFTNAGTGSFIAGPVAPTSGAPIEIKSVGDKTVNLFDNANCDFIQNGYIDDAGLVQPDSNIGYTNAYIPVKPNTTYTWSGKNGVSVGGNYSICEYTSDKTFVSRHSRHETTADDTFTTGANTYYLRFNIKLTDTRTALQLEQGGTATSYVPYGYEIPIIIGSNCGFVDLGTLDWFYNENLGCGKTFYATLTAKNANGEVICFCDGFTGISANSAYMSQRDVDKVCWIEDGHSIRFHNDIYNGDKDAFKQAMSGKYLYYQRTTDSSWAVPTTTPIYLNNPLRKVGTYADYIDYENQQIVRNVGVKVLDGTENWSIQTNNVYSLSKTSLVNSNLPSNSTNLLSNYFYAQTSVDSATGQVWVGNNYINFNYDNSNEYLADFKAFLADQYANGTPVIVIYPFKTPVTESLTVPALTMAEGTNNITTDTEIKPSDMYAKGKVSQL